MDPTFHLTCGLESHLMLNKLFTAFFTAWLPSNILADHFFEYSSYHFVFVTLEADDTGPVAASIFTSLAAGVLQH